MTDLQASLGISQLNRLGSFIIKRKEIAEIYNAHFKAINEIKCPMQLDNTESGWHLYTIQLVLDQLRKGRKEIFNQLRSLNIGVHVHYIPVYWHPYYQKLGYEKGLCPKAERWYEQDLTLPIFPKMNQKDIEDVILAVKKVVV
jgi:dTDP-4-amino-4,6-dideoxygalactose transaminase